MGQIVGYEILKRARVQLNDPDRVRWTDEFLLDALNDAQREVVILKPEASSRTEPLGLVVNTCQQAIPAEALKLLDIACNMGSNGTTPGRAITLVMKSEMDRIDPLWRTRKGTYVKHYVYDGRVPREFFVYPAVTDPWQVEASLSFLPVDVTLKGVDGETVNSVISIDDVYSTALFDYVMMRAHYKDTDVRNDLEGTEEYKRFLQRLGLKVVADKAMDPNRNAPPRDERRAAGAPDGQASF